MNLDIRILSKKDTYSYAYLFLIFSVSMVLSFLCVDGRLFLRRALIAARKPHELRPGLAGVLWVLARHAIRPPVTPRWHPAAMVRHLCGHRTPDRMLGDFNRP